MAERRMFAKSILASDPFLDLPDSAKTLYFYLAEYADDEGFVNNPKFFMRLLGSSPDNMNLLISKKFLIWFDSGVLVIRHWNIHNSIRSDRKNPTICQEERQQLTISANNEYIKRAPDAPELAGSNDYTNIWESLSEDQIDHIQQIFEDPINLIDSVHDYVKEHAIRINSSVIGYIVSYGNNNGWPKKTVIPEA